MIKLLIVLAAAYALLAAAVRSRRGVPARTKIEQRVRAFVDRTNYAIVAALTVTAIYVVVSRILWSL